MKKQCIGYSEFKNLIQTKEIIFFDVETTGFSGKKDRLLSFSAIKTKFENGKFVETGRFDQMFDPGIYIPKEITNINHIDNNIVFGCPSEWDCVNIINSFIGTDALLCGYNVRFDMRFMNDVYERLDSNFKFSEIFDVYGLVKKMDIKSENKKLGTMAAYFKADRGLQFHNSLDDVIATYRVLEKMIEKIEQEGTAGKPSTKPAERQPILYLAVFGPAYLKNQTFVDAWLNAVMKNRDPQKVCIVVDNNQGTARLALNYAYTKHIKVQTFYPEWNKYKDAAPIIKNDQLHQFLLARENAGILAFEDGRDMNIKRQIEWGQTKGIATKNVDLKKYQKR